MQHILWFINLSWLEHRFRVMYLRKSYLKSGGGHMVELGKVIIYSGDVQISWEFVSKCDPDFSYFSTESRDWSFCCQTWQGTWYLLRIFGEICSKLHVVCGLPYTNPKLVTSEKCFPIFFTCFGVFFCFCFQLLSNFPCQHGGVQLHSELLACGVTNKLLENILGKEINASFM